MKNSMLLLLVFALHTSVYADMKKIICWGDSITEGMGMTPQATYPARLQTLLGERFRVLNSGDGGEDAVTIPVRQGSLGIQTSVRILFDEGVRKVQVGNESDNGFRTIAGEKIKLTEALGRDVPVNPVVIGSDSYRLSFTEFKWNTSEHPILYKLWLERDDDTGGVEIPAGQSVSFASASAVRDAFCEVILMGANGGWKNEMGNLIDRYKMMVSRRGSEKPFIVIVPFWGDITDEQARVFKSAFGRHAVDFRGESIRRGLEVEGLEATELDRREMAFCRVPPSLLYQNRPNCHLNAKGYDFLARLVFERGKMLGYWNEPEERNSK